MLRHDGSPTTGSHEELAHVNPNSPMAVLYGHVGLTVPKLKKFLKPECFEDVCENEDYPNTFTQCVVVAVALRTLEAVGVKERIAVRQELYTMEDYAGF